MRRVTQSYERYVVPHLAQTLGEDIPYFYELITAPADKILDRWFESEPLKATLATDAVIGAMISSSSSGSRWVECRP